MKKFFLTIIVIVFSLFLITPADAYVKVKGYFRKDGTYVSPHVRSNPNGIKYDNYGYKPNQGLYNPSYGTKGNTWDTPSYITDPDYYTGKSLYESKNTYSYINTNTPSCPSFSTYDSLSGTCKCYSGYQVDKGILGNEQCVSNLTYCTSHYGYGTTYDSSTNGCKCRSGYNFNGSKCELDLTSYNLPTPSIDWSKYKYSSDDKSTVIDNNATCKAKHGNPSKYDSASRTCVCGSGYIMNTNQMCEEGQIFCERNYGGKDRSYYETKDSLCYTCPAGYRVDRKTNKCIDLSYKAPSSGNYIVVRDVTVYEKTTVKSNSLDVLKKGTHIEVVKIVGGWAKVKLQNGNFGYVPRNKISSK